MEDLRYVQVRWEDHDDLSRALGIEPGVVEWHKLIEMVAAARARMASSPPLPRDVRGALRGELRDANEEIERLRAELRDVESQRVNAVRLWQDAVHSWSHTSRERDEAQARVDELEAEQGVH